MARVPVIGLVAVLMLADIALGQGAGGAPAAPASGVLLGSPTFQPTPEHPIGWRGDWTGHYPDATPPTHWGRWPKATKDIRVQTGEPGATPGASARPVPLGVVSDWLVAGPFEPKDAANDVDETFITNDAGPRPLEGAPAAPAPAPGNAPGHPGSVKWERRQTWSYTITAAPAKAKGTDSPPPPSIFYAYTNLWSPQATKARLLLSHDPGMKIWLNGKEVYSAAKAQSGVWGEAGRKAVAIELDKGWNRLLLKGGGMGLLLAPPTPVEMVSENIVWTIPMPRPSVALPVIVGDRLFVCSEPSDLLCLNKADGKILWIRPNHFGIAVPAEERPAAFADNVAPLMVELQQTDHQVVALINAGKAVGAALMKLKTDTEWKIYDELKAIDGKWKRNGPGQYEWASPTPCTDGKSVYVFYTNGVAAQYDLEGKLLWATKVTNVGGGEHGQHYSPVLIGGRFICAVNHSVRGLDSETGKVLWETKAGDWLTPTKIGGVDVVVASRGAVIRASDGVILSDLKLQNAYGWSTPVIDGGTMYDYLSRGDRSGGWFAAAALPTKAEPGAKPGPIKRIEFTDRGLEQGWYDSSLLVHDGLVYALNATGDLYVMDFAAGKIVYKQALDMHPFVQYVVMPGAAASPALAGKCIYLMDNQGTTAVVEPGRQFNQVGLNLIDNSTYVTIGDWGSAFGQEETLSTPVFEGGRIYIRGQACLYCVGEK